MKPNTFQTYIQIDALKPGFLYEICARNSNRGVWWPAKQGFIIQREKFERHYLFVELHWDTGEPFGTVQPLRELGPFPMPLEQLVDLYQEKPAEGDAKHADYGRALDLLAPDA